MVKIQDLPKHKRPREKLIEKGAENLGNKELLAILLRTGSKGKSAIDIAGQVLKKFPIDSLLSMEYESLTKIKGISRGKACTLLAAFELSRRALDKFDDNLPVVDSPQAAMDQLTELRKYKKEYFVCLYLNARNQLIHKEVISIGTLNNSLVHPREVFAPAITHLASSLILSHNHPSGSLERSNEDVEVTNKLTAAADLLGIQVMDHLIVTANGFVSFRERVG